MENVSTRYEKKTVKKEKPSRSVIESILNYSRSLAVLTNPYGKSIMVINN